MSLKGTVVNIQRYTVHDGPGIRTEFFLKGCPLSCPWCGNPESRLADPEPGIYPAKCIGSDLCTACTNACPVPGAITFKDGKIDRIDREKCSGCMKCFDACPAEAIRRWGRQMSADEAMDVILRDRAYYKASDGGITVSGGDPLVQADFVKALFERCRAEGIHTCLESSLYASRDVIEPLLACTDMMISDLKHMDSRRHKSVIGVGNELILDNIERIALAGMPLILRVPLIPGFNDDEDNIRASALYLKERLKNRVQQVQILPFMRLGEEKYRSLDRDYPMRDIDDGTRERCNGRAREIAEDFNSKGIPCIVGTSHKESSH